jgi:uncharacterized protein
MRLIVLIVLVVLAVWLVRRALRGPAPAQTKPAKEQPGELIRCAHCGLHLPRAEARQAQGALFCSEDHARRGTR